MSFGFRRKLLTGVSAAAIVVLVGASDAKAQASAPQPVSFDLFVQGGYGFAGDNSTPFAEVRSGGFQSPARSVLNVGSGDGWNGKVGGAVHFMNVWSAQLAYTGLRSTRTLGTPTYTPSFPLVSVLAGGFTNPGFAGVGTSWNRATVRTETRADVIDFQAGYDVGLGGVSTTLLGGLRFGSFNQDTAVTLFDTSGGAEVNDQRQARFQGIGPTLGAKAEMPLPVPVAGVGIEGAILAGVLFGEVRSQTTGMFTNGNLQRPRNFSKDTVSPNVDAELALTYGMPVGGATMQLAAGYQVSYYGGVRDTANGASSTGSEQFGSTTDDLLYYGPFIRLKMHW
jgi:hypothetical protein